MENKVYLWELDSVRNSPDECCIARKKLYSQLFVEGNIVVMTCNQLADGRWLIPLLEDEENYQDLLKLFKIGAIKISHYNSIRTLSQYTQNALEKALNNKDDFVFSGMSVEKEERYLLQEVLGAVRYSDPERLKSDMECLQALYDSVLDLSPDSKLMLSIKKEKARLEKEQDVGEPASFDIQVCTYYYLKGMAMQSEKLSNCLKYEIGRLLLIYRYVKLILLISMEKTSDNDPVEQSTPLMDIMRYIFQMKDDIIENCDVVWKTLFDDAVSEMWKKKIDNRCANSRSYWYHLINIKRKEDPASKKQMHDFQTLIVDVCYNFTLESSIEGINCTFDSDKERFVDEFVDRLNEYYFLYEEGIHHVNKIKHANSAEKEGIDWKQLAEIREDVYKIESKKKKPVKKTVKWSRKIFKTQIFLPLETFVASIILLLIANFVGTGCMHLFEKIDNIGPDQFLTNIKDGIPLIINNISASIFESAVWMELLKTIVKKLLSASVGVIILNMIVSFIQKKMVISDILDIISHWSHKLGNGIKFIHNRWRLKQHRIELGKGWIKIMYKSCR